MQNVQNLKVSPKTLLGEEEFAKYKRANRKWYLLLSIILISIFILVAFNINYKEIELGIYIGALLFSYCVPLGVLASKNKSSPTLWVVLTILTMGVFGFVISHVLMTRKGFKNEWL